MRAARAPSFSGRTPRSQRGNRGSIPCGAATFKLPGARWERGGLQSRGVTLVGADLDESPMAYRRLPEVLAHHAGSVRVLHTLRPFAVVMAGADVFDPFKD